MDNETRKAINFDLDTEKLRTYYCKTNNDFERLKAYNEIKDFLLGNGFSHRQWSGYTSDNPMSKSDVLFVITDLSKKKPWFPKCVNKCDVTEIGDQFDLMCAIQEAANDSTDIQQVEISNKTTNIPSDKIAPIADTTDMLQKFEHRVLCAETVLPDIDDTPNEITDSELLTKSNLSNAIQIE